MLINKPQPVKTAANLNDRVKRLLEEPATMNTNSLQLSLDLGIDSGKDVEQHNFPSESVSAFLDFVTDAMPDGDIFLFGGVLRDLALYGRKGFNSDIDLVVDGDWTNLLPYIHSLNAKKNKFGGYRFRLGDWPIDIWNAKDTWAIAKDIVPYRGISSLINTTVLNWDAILMNWRTKRFIHRSNYFEEIQNRVMDIVLHENPNPLGMAVRVFRHFCLKDARKISKVAACYLAKATKTFDYKTIKNAEITSYQNSIIEEKVHQFFELIDISKEEVIDHEFSLAHKIMEQEFVFRYHD